MPKYNAKPDADFLFPKRQATQELAAELRAKGISVAEYYRNKEGENANAENAEAGGGAGSVGSGQGEGGGGAGVGGGETAGRDNRPIEVSAGLPEAAPPPSGQPGVQGEVTQTTPVYECANCGFDLVKTDSYCPSCGKRLRWEEVT